MSTSKIPVFDHPSYPSTQTQSYVKHDVRSVTGSNLRNILLLTDKDTVEEINSIDIKKLKYHEVTKENDWKIELLKEIIETKNNQLSISEFSVEELNDILEYLCTSQVIIFYWVLPIIYLYVQLLEPMYIVFENKT